MTFDDDHDDWDEDPNRNCCFRFKHVILIYSAMALTLGVILMLAGFLMRSSGLDEMLSLKLYSLIEQQTGYNAAHLSSIAVTLSITAGFIYVLDIFPAWVGILKPNIISVYIFAAFNAIAVIILIVTLALSVKSLQGISDDNVRSMMNTSLLVQYGTNLNQTENKDITDAWDQMQSKTHCCGVDNDGWHIYSSSKWYQQFIIPGYNIQYTPASCCSKSYSNSSLPCAVNVSAPETSPVFTQGCYSLLTSRIRTVSEAVIGLSAAFGVITLYGEMLIFIHIGMTLTARKTQENIRTDSKHEKESYGSVHH